MDFYSALKAVSMVATGGFGVLGVLTNYKDKEGRVTKWGKVAIVGIFLSGTLSLVLYGMEEAKATEGAKEAKKQYEQTIEYSNRLLILQRTSLDKSRALEERLGSAAGSLEKINTLSQLIAQKQATLLNSQSTVISAEDRLQVWQIRGFFPLSPMTLHYSVEFSLDAEWLARYRNRLLASVTRRYQPPPSNNSEPIAAADMTNVDENLPIEGEELPSFKDGRADILTHAAIEFEFSKGMTGGNVFQIATTSSLSSDLSNCTLSLFVNFHRHFIFQYVKCDNIQPNDNLALSSLDLVGRKMTWRSMGNFFIGEEPRLEYVEFTFPNQSSGNAIDLSEYSGEDGVILTAHMLRLDRILAGTKIPPL